MVIPPVYWSLLGEIALIIIGVLATVIIVVLKDRKKLKEYSSYLKEVIKKLKKKLQQSEDEQSQERVLELLNAMVEHIREQYQSLYGNGMAAVDEEAEEGSRASVEKFVFIAGFQTMIAALNALENSNDPEAAWLKIQNELTPLFHNYLQPMVAGSNATESENIKHRLENADNRIENLEKFKQLYFDLQPSLSKNLAQIEALNQQLLSLADGTDQFAEIKSVIEKNKTLYLEMGQMIAMNKDQHHESVADTMDYSEAIINERKDEISRLKHKIAQQFEDIWKLQNSLSGSGAEAPDAEELKAAVETMSRNLKDAEMCIETMDMEIQTLTTEILNLRKQLKTDQNGVNSEEKKQAQEEQETMIARFSQENKELMSCIAGLEDDNQGQYNRIKELEEQHESLETEYLSMEAKYQEVRSKLNIYK